jgi:hypothetical protein
MIAGMTTPAPPLIVGSIRIEVRDGKVKITPNKPHPGSPVVVDASRLERWAARIYRDEVLR